MGVRRQPCTCPLCTHGALTVCVAEGRPVSVGLDRKSPRRWGWCWWQHGELVFSPVAARAACVAVGASVRERQRSAVPCVTQPGVGVALWRACGFNRGFFLHGTQHGARFTCAATGEPGTVQGCFGCIRKKSPVFLLAIFAPCVGSSGVRDLAAPPLGGRGCLPVRDISLPQWFTVSRSFHT